MQAADDSKRTDSPAQHSALSEIVSLVGKQSLSLFQGNMVFQQNRRCNFSHFLDMIKTGLFFTLFSYFCIIELLSNSNWTEWSTFQGVIMRVISKSEERGAI